ncbi:MAG: hypothetical protein PVH58_18845, partial [Desulfobacterales bacterium]
SLVTTLMLSNSVPKCHCELRLGLSRHSLGKKRVGAWGKGIQIQRQIDNRLPKADYIVKPKPL